MSSSIALSIIAVVLSVGDGAVTVGGDSIGLLQPGDRGEIFYELKVGGETRRIEVGSAHVLSVGDGEAALAPSVDVDTIRKGYSVELSVPYDRLGTAATGEADRLREQLAALQQTLDETAAKLTRQRTELDTRAGSEGALAELRQRVEGLERRNAELEVEREALRFILGKSIAESEK